MKAFLAIIINMGLIDIPKLADYWKTSWESYVPYFGKVMSRNRFQSILSFLHASHTPPGCIPKKIDKVKMFLDCLFPKFQMLYNPSENISIDETMIGHRGRFGAIQYMPQKPTKWGIKVYSIADSLNGYLLDGIIYTGSETYSSTSQYSHLPKTTQIVMNLVTPFLDNGYHLFTDRFYTSIPLAEELEDRKTRLTGTINNTRVDLPDTIRGTRKNKFTLPANGYMAFRRGRQMLAAWRPEKKKNVFILSTGYIAELTTVSRNRRSPLLKPKAVLG